jgi:dTDP-glucose 4,6-dehydratase
VVARTFHNYGPRLTPRTVTGSVIAQALLADRVELGSVEPRRDFGYCADTVRARLSIALSGRPGRTYCIGSGRSISIGAWARSIVDAGVEAGVWAEREVVTVGETVRPGGQPDAIRCDPARLRADTGWRPAVDRSEGIRRTIDWYVANPGRWLDRVDWVGDREAALRRLDRARAR